MKFVQMAWIEPKVDAELILLMRKIGLTRLAKNAGMDRSLISHWFRGRTGMSMGKYQSLMHWIERLKDA